jgi:hypothetical protein
MFYATAHVTNPMKWQIYTVNSAITVIIINGFIGILRHFQQISSRFAPFWLGGRVVEDVDRKWVEDVHKCWRLVGLGN